MTINLFGKQIDVKKEAVIAIVVVLATLAGLAGYLIIKSDRDIIIDSQSEAAAVIPANTPEVSASSGNEDKTAVESNGKKAEEIKVYVVGCVKNQGILTMEKGQLIDDAIRLAGGVTQDADLSSINLVYELKENVMLYIKSKKEVQQVRESGGGAGNAGKGIKLVADSGGAVVNQSETSASSGGRININTATAGELDTLPGIGEATARDIISYRENNGLFKTVQDIMKVPRIKESRFASIKDFITVD